MSRNGLNIVYLYADSLSEWNCSCWRCLIPADATNAEREAGRSAHSGKLYYLPTALDWRAVAVQRALAEADVLMFQRNVLTSEVWDAMDYWRAIGKTVTVDADDFYPELPPSNPAHDYWARNRYGLDPDPVSALIEGLKHADAFTAPSKVLLADFAHIVPGYHIPNFTRRAWYENLMTRPAGAPDLRFGYDAENNLVSAPRPDSADWHILGWGGSISHVDSWVYSGVVEALDRIFEKHPRARLKFCGHEGRLDYLFERWGDRVVRQEGVKPEHWPMVVSTFDVGLAPLDTRPLDPPWREGAPRLSYDERRSWLKGIEYLCAGVPWVASHSATYIDLKAHGTLVPNTPDDWFRALDYKLTNLDSERARAWTKRDYALRKFTMEANVNAVGDIYGRIIADRQVKHGARLPGIRYTQPVAAAA